MKCRVFAAIEISEAARLAIAEYVSSLRQKFPDVQVRWERPEKLHLTVKFAGSLDEEQLGIFTAKVRVAANAVGPFRVRMAGMGVFVKRRGPTVLWIGVEKMPSESDPLREIAKRLVGEESQSFHPHITIARIKDAKQAKEPIEAHETSAIDPVEFEVNELAIYESTLLPAGSVYAKLASFPLSLDKS